MAINAELFLIRENIPSKMQSLLNYFAILCDINDVHNAKRITISTAIKIRINY